jgi:hypothetical protein
MQLARVFVRLLLPVLLVLPATAGAAAAADAARIRVLIVDGYSNHDWRLTTRLIRGILEPTGLFDVSVSTAPANADAPGWDAWRPKFADYDVVIQTCNDLGGGPRWPRAVEETFERFVRDGGGVYVWHAGNNAFAGWPAYNDMIGLGWRKKDFSDAIAINTDGTLRRIPAGEGTDTGHGARVDTVVHRLGEHPIHAGLPRAWKTPDIEVYHFARGPAKNLTVLSYGYDPETKMNWPLEWTVAYGRGRVYTSTFGHVWAGDTDPARMRCAGVQTIVMRALQWLAGRPVTFPVPADFPTADRISVRATAATAASEPTSARAANSDPAAVGSPPTPPPLQTEFVYEAIVEIGAAVDVGATPLGHRRYIPITGGTFAGPRCRGTILPGGADWQTDRTDGVTEADALYSVRADDGTVIIVHNRGVIAHGGAYMRTALRFEAPAGPFGWLNESQFLSSISGGPRPGTVIIRVFRVL